MGEAFKAQGLHDAMYLIPVALLLTLVFCWRLRGASAAMRGACARGWSSRLRQLGGLPRPDLFGA